MKIILNGEPIEVGGATLQAALDEQGLGEARIATAVNEAFVAKTARADFALSEGDRVEVLAPMQGG